MTMHAAFADTSTAEPLVFGGPTQLALREVDKKERCSPAFRTAWQAIPRHAAEPQPFLQDWFLGPALDHLARSRNVHLLALGDGEIVAGLLPAQLCATYYHYPLPHLGGWLHGNAFLGAPLVAAGCEETFWRALLEWADERGGTALFLHLSHIPLGGPLHRALERVCTEQERGMALVHREERALLRSDLSPQEYWDRSLSAKHRKDLRRQERRLGELGELAFERSCEASSLEAWVADFLTLEQAGWKGTRGSALARRRATADLFRDVMAQGTRAGQVERLALTLDGRPIAMLANLLAAPGAFAFKTAYDEDLARYSPGVLLQRHNLGLLERADIDWCDSCASAGHPMIDRLWRERRAIGRFNIAIGGPRRRRLFEALRAREGETR